MNANRAFCLSAAAIFLAGEAAPLRAETTASATMAVSAEVVANCTVAAQPMAFGTMTQAEAPSRGATASIDVACGPGVPFTVELDAGRNSAGGTRRALDPASGNYLAYAIFTDPGHTRPWGGLGPQAVSAATDATGTARLIAYGLIDSAPQIVAGRYADEVTVTVDF